MDIIKIFTFLQPLFFFPMLSSSKMAELCFFIHFQRIDVKSNRSFGGLLFISIILWEYCENNIKAFYENNRIISWKTIMAGANQTNISSNIFSACLMKCWMKNHVFHMTNFLVCTRSSNIPSNIWTFIHKFKFKIS